METEASAEEYRFKYIRALEERISVTDKLRSEEAKTGILTTDVLLLHKEAAALRTALAPFLNHGAAPPPQARISEVANRILANALALEAGSHASKNWQDGLALAAGPRLTQVQGDQPRPLMTALEPLRNSPQPQPAQSQSLPIGVAIPPSQQHAFPPSKLQTQQFRLVIPWPLALQKYNVITPENALTEQQFMAIEDWTLKFLASHVGDSCTAAGMAVPFKAGNVEKCYGIPQDLIGEFVNAAKLTLGGFDGGSATRFVSSGELMGTKLNGGVLIGTSNGVTGAPRPLPFHATQHPSNLFSLQQNTSPFMPPAPLQQSPQEQIPPPTQSAPTHSVPVPKRALPTLLPAQLNSRATPSQDHIREFTVAHQQEHLRAQQNHAQARQEAQAYLQSLLHKSAPAPCTNVSPQDATMPVDVPTPLLPQMEFETPRDVSEPPAAKPVIEELFGSTHDAPSSAEMSPHPSSPDASSTSIVASGVAIARPAATETASKRKKRVCGNCAGTRSSVWRPAFPPAEGVLCNRCHGRAVQAAHAAEEDEEEASEEGQAVEEEMAEDVDVLDLGGVRASRRRGSMPVAEKKEDGKKGRRKSAFAVLKATGKKEKGGKRSKGKIAELTEGEDVNEEAHTKEEQVETEDMAEAGIKESPRSRASPRRTKAADDPVTVSPNKEKTMDETPTAKRVKLNDGAASESGTVSPKKDAEQAKDVEEKDEKMDDLFHKPAFEAETISANKSPARTTVEPVLTPSASNELIAICAEKTEEKTEFVCIKVATDKSNLTKYTKILNVMMAEFQTVPQEKRVALKRKVKDYLVSRLGDIELVTMRAAGQPKTYGIPREILADFKLWGYKELKTSFPSSKVYMAK